MEHDPVLFDSTELETASEAVLFCQAYLEEKGFNGLAANLEGLTPITNVDVGVLAARMLHEMLPQVRKGHPQAAEYVRIALQTTTRAVQSARNVQLVA